MAVAIELSVTLWIMLGCAVKLIEPVQLLG
jgi:hypothetical protein